MHFDLLREPWIPVVDGRNPQGRLVSINAALGQAHELSEIAVQSPVVEVALHRLLLAILHRALEGPKDAAEWRRLWSAGHFNTTVLSRYFEKVGARFDLFHPIWPFYQTHGMDVGYALKDVAALDVMSTKYGAVPTLFDDARAGDEGARPARAALWLVAHQTYALGGTLSRLRGEPASAVGAPLARAATSLMQGTSLFKTLMLNLRPYRHSAADRPAWERGSTQRGERVPDGLVDLYTWQSRRAWLRPVNPARPLDQALRHCQIADGWHWPKTWTPLGLEPMVAWRRRQKTKEETEIVLLLASADRASWRDWAVLAESGGAHIRPLVVDWATEVLERGYVEPQDVVGVEMCAVPTDKFKIMAARRQVIPLSVPPKAAILANRAWYVVSSLIQWAAKEQLDRLSADGRKRLRERLLHPADHRYWTSLDSVFVQLTWPQDMERWRDTIVVAAQRAFAASEPAHIDHDYGRWVRAGSFLGSRLRQALDEDSGGEDDEQSDDKDGS